MIMGAIKQSLKVVLMFPVEPFYMMKWVPPDSLSAEAKVKIITAKSLYTINSYGWNWE